MQVILLERVEKLGTIGDEVRVKPGFARNFLLPQGIALRATGANRKKFEAQREMIETRNQERAAAARTDAEKIDGSSFILIRQAGESGQLYGSVSARDIVETVNGETDIKIERSQVRLDKPIKAVGLHEVGIRLHADVRINVTMNVARSDDEAERQARGEDVIAAAQELERAEAAEQANQIADASFEEDEEGVGGTNEAAADMAGESDGDEG